MVLLYENLGTMALNDGQGMTATQILEAHEVSSNPRILVAGALVGGSGVTDSQITIKIGHKLIASLHNNDTDLSLERDCMLPINEYIPAGQTISIACVDAFPADCWIALDIIVLPKPRSGRGRRY